MVALNTSYQNLPDRAKEPHGEPPTIIEELDEEHTRAARREEDSGGV